MRAYYEYPLLRELAFLWPPLFYWRQVTLRALLRHLPAEAPPRLLEIGCATGFLTRKLRERYPGTEIWAVDLSRRAIRRAQRRRLPGVHFRVADFLDRLPQRGFPLVVSMNVFQLLPQDLAFQRLRDLLAPGGRALLTLTSETLLTRWHRRLYRALARSDVCLDSPETVARRARAVGLAVELAPIEATEGSYLLTLQRL